MKCELNTTGYWEKQLMMCMVLCAVRGLYDVINNENISYNTATKYVKILEELSTLNQINEQPRYRFICLQRLFDDFHRIIMSCVIV